MIGMIMFLIKESVNRDSIYLSVHAWTSLWTGRHGLMASQRPILSGNLGPTM